MVSSSPGVCGARSVHVARAGAALLAYLILRRPSSGMMGGSPQHFASMCTRRSSGSIRSRWTRVAEHRLRRSRLTEAYRRHCAEEAQLVPAVWRGMPSSHCLCLCPCLVCLIVGQSWSMSNGPCRRGDTPHCARSTEGSTGCARRFGTAQTSTVVEELRLGTCSLPVQATQTTVTTLAALSTKSLLRTTLVVYRRTHLQHLIAANMSHAAGRAARSRGRPRDSCVLYAAQERYRIGTPCHLPVSVPSVVLRPCVVILSRYARSLSFRRNTHMSPSVGVSGSVDLRRSESAV